MGSTYIWSETNLRSDDPESRRLNRRDVDEFLGLCRGMCADGEITDAELLELTGWVEWSGRIDSLPLVNKVSAFLSSLPPDHGPSHRAELLSLLRKLTGELKDGRMTPTTLPFDEPMPELDFQDVSYCFTGTFRYGSQTACENAVRRRGGLVKRKVTLKTDVLVIGSEVTDAWLHGSYGTKISTAMRWRENGQKDIAIVSETHWEECLLSVEPTISLRGFDLEDCDDPIAMAFDLAENGEISREEFDAAVGGKVPFPDAPQDFKPSARRSKPSRRNSNAESPSSTAGSPSQPSPTDRKFWCSWFSVAIIILFTLAFIWTTAALKNLRQNVTTSELATLPQSAETTP